MYHRQPKIANLAGAPGQCRRQPARAAVAVRAQSAVLHSCARRMGLTMESLGALRLTRATKKARVSMEDGEAAPFYDMPNAPGKSWRRKARAFKNSGRIERRAVQTGDRRVPPLSGDDARRVLRRRCSHTVRDRRKASLGKSIMGEGICRSRFMPDFGARAWLANPAHPRRSALRRNGETRSLTLPNPSTATGSR